MTAITLTNTAWPVFGDFRAVKRKLRAAAAVLVALTMSLNVYVASARADGFDFVMQVMGVIDTAAPGALPFTAKDMQAAHALIVNCGNLSDSNALSACVEAAAANDPGFDEGTLGQLIAVYLDIVQHDYWGLVQDAGKAAACAAANILTGVDVCALIDTIAAAGEAIGEGGIAIATAVSDFFNDLEHWTEGELCTIASLVGACSQSSPPTAMTTAQGICNGRGGVAQMTSPNNAPDNLRFTCGDGTQCDITPGHAVCQTAQQKALLTQQQQAQNAVDFATRPQQWAVQFDAKWAAQCGDDTCKFGLNLIKQNIFALAKNRHAADPNYTWGQMSFDLQKADAQAQKLVAEYNQRQVVKSQCTGAQCTSAGCGVYTCTSGAGVDACKSVFAGQSPPPSCVLKPTYQGFGSGISHQDYWVCGSPPTQYCLQTTSGPGVKPPKGCIHADQIAGPNAKIACGPPKLIDNR